MVGHLVEVATNKKVMTFSGSKGKKLIGNISGDEKYLAAEKIFSSAITLWDTKTRKELKTLPMQEVKILDVLFSSCNKYVGVKTKDYVKVWNVSTGAEVKKQEGEKSSLKDVFRSLAKH